MTADFEILIRPRQTESPRGLACFLGSFDPVHRGHLWIMRHMLEHNEQLLVLVPTRHFEKNVVRGRNADYRQRIDMLGLLPADVVSRSSFGLAHEVLFVRLAIAVAERFGATPRFGMGNDTYQRMLGSPALFSELGLSWGEAEQRSYEALRDESLVYARTSREPRMIELPRALRSLSSTEVRRRAARLPAATAREAWQRRLHDALTPAVAEYLFRAGLYRRDDDGPGREAG